MADHIYVGSGKEKTFQDGGSIITITVDIDSLNREFPNYGFTTEQGKRKIKIKIGRRREIDQYGNSHLVEIDTWKPENASQSTQGASNGNGYQKREQSPSKPLSGSANGVPDFEDDDFAPGGVPVF